MAVLLELFFAVLVQSGNSRVDSITLFDILLSQKRPLRPRISAKCALVASTSIEIILVSY